MVDATTIEICSSYLFWLPALANTFAARVTVEDVDDVPETAESPIVTSEYKGESPFRSLYHNMGTSVLLFSRATNHQIRLPSLLTR